MKTYYIIYGLRDPYTQEIRYVGKSSSGLKRPKAHFTPSGRRARTYCARWLRSLKRQPDIVVLQVVALRDELANAERAWIAIGRAALGNRLTNLTIGGEGCTGRAVSAETRAKLRVANSNKPTNWRAIEKAAAKNRQLWATSEYRSRMSSTLRGLKRSVEARRTTSRVTRERWRDPQFKAKTSVAIAKGKRTPEARETRRSSVGRWHTAATKARIAQTLRGRRRPPETIAKVRARAIGRVASLETRKKMSETHRRRWAARKAQHGDQ